MHTDLEAGVHVDPLERTWDRLGVIAVGNGFVTIEGLGRPVVGGPPDLDSRVGALVGNGSLARRRGDGCRAGTRGEDQSESAHGHQDKDGSLHGGSFLGWGQRP